MYDDEPPWPPLSLDDAALTQQELDERFPPGSRYPDHRDLLITDAWYDRHGQRHELHRLDASDLESLLLGLLSEAVTLHAQAASDEQQTLSSALSWAYNVLGVDKVAHLHPLVWLDSTPLVRGYQRRLAAKRE